MNDETRSDLQTVIEHLEEKGVLTASDSKAIAQALQQLPRGGAAPQTSETPLAVNDPYYEARHRALHDPKVHP